MTNTTQKGNKFEQRVLKLFEDELKNNRLFVNPQHCKVFHKKGYYSNDRKGNIVVDISIEVFLPDAIDFSILIIIECKNYSHPVPVDDVEEFFAKLQQISGANTKGIIVSTNSFQEGTLSYSKSKGIGLVRILDNKNFKWHLKRATTGLVTYKEKEKTEIDIYNGLITENYSNNQIDFLCQINDEYTYSANSLFEQMLKEDIYSFGVPFREHLICEEKDDISFVPYLPIEEIENAAQELLIDFDYKQGAVKIKDLCDFIGNKNQVSFIYKDTLGIDELGFDILGRIFFKPTKIFISQKANVNQYREKFTIAHEIGHYILNHENYMSKEYYAENDFENSNFEEIKIKDIKRLEWQANSFASNLILPKENLLKEFYKCLEEFEIKDKGFGALFVDKQECNVKHFYKVTNKLKEKFEVSRKVVSIRLKDLGLLKDSNNLTVNSIFNMSNYF